MEIIKFRALLNQTSYELMKFGTRLMVECASGEGCSYNVFIKKDGDNAVGVDEEGKKVFFTNDCRILSLLNKMVMTLGVIVDYKNEFLYINVLYPSDEEINTNYPNLKIKEEIKSSQEGIEGSKKDEVYMCFVSVTDGMYSEQEYHNLRKYLSKYAKDIADGKTVKISLCFDSSKEYWFIEIENDNQKLYLSCFDRDAREDSTFSAWLDKMNKINCSINNEGAKFEGALTEIRSYDEEDDSISLDFDVFEPNFANLKKREQPIKMVNVKLNAILRNYESKEFANYIKDEIAQNGYYYGFVEKCIGDYCEFQVKLYSMDKVHVSTKKPTRYHIEKNDYKSYIEKDLRQIDCFFQSEKYLKIKITHIEFVFSDIINMDAIIYSIPPELEEI